MGIKVSFDKNSIERKIAEAARQKAKTMKYEVACPHCGNKVSVPIGKGSCPFCKNEINVNLNFDF